MLGALLLMGLAPISAAASTAPGDLAALAAEYWEGALRAQPIFATSLGDRRYDDLLPDVTAAGRARERARIEAVRARAQAIDPDSLGAADRITRSALIEVTDGDLAVLDCDFDAWLVDPLNGPQVDLLNIPSIQTVETPAAAEAMVARWRAMGPYLEATIENLRTGLAADRVAVADQVRRVLDQLDELLARPIADWPLNDPLREEHPDLTPSEAEGFATGLRSTVADVIRPAFLRYRDFLRSEVAPRARPAERAGLVYLASGDECYRLMIQAHTSLDLPAGEIHQIGLDEVERIDRETSTLGQRILGTGDLEAIHARLRSDPSLYFGSADEIETKAREALARAQAAVPAWFGLEPHVPCEVVRMEPHEEKHSTIAYYRQPAADGSRPGRFYVNTSAPATRPRYEAEALAFHEAVPGHHLQIAIAQGLTDLPAFRRHTGSTAFVEGWALYTEQLAGEMGLYSGDLDRMGKLSYESWRACRLVVDTGLHAFGWSRQQAIDFMTAHTALAQNNIENEVDRYISSPGQALAYKLGQLEILKLREEARQRLGDRFDIRRFHDCVLENGAVGLRTLRAVVEDCVGSTERP